MTESRRMGAPMRTIDRTTGGTFVPRTVLHSRLLPTETAKRGRDRNTKVRRTQLVDLSLSNRNRNVPGWI
jgi:hypothetical protein